MAKRAKRSIGRGAGSAGAVDDVVPGVAAGPTDPSWEPELYRTAETRHALQAAMLELASSMARRGFSPQTFVEAIALLDEVAPVAPAEPAASAA